MLDCMTYNQICYECDKDYVANLFNRCWKMFEDAYHIKISSWHANQPSMSEMSYWLSMLSERCWKASKKNVVFELKFKSLEELDLKLAIRGF